MVQNAAYNIPGHFNPDNLQVTFRNKSDYEMRLAYWLFSMMGKPALVKAGGLATTWALRIGLPVKGLIRNTVYRHFCGGETVHEAKEVVQKLSSACVQTVLDYAAEAQDTEDGFDAVHDEVLRNIQLARSTEGLSCISVKLTGIGHNAILEKLHQGQKLSSDERKAFTQTAVRLDNICKAAAEAGVTVYIDAEESWLQRPIDELAEEMMRRYNKQRAVVFNTLQMYRTDRVAYLKSCLKHFKKEPVTLGIKIVRGAYIEKEQQRAREQGYPSPVFTKKEDTDRSFNKAIDLCLENLHRLELCAATHNEKSIKYLTERIQQDSISDHKQRIHFSQLYGMSDNLTFNLADAGYNTSKYLPYGEVATAMPYLLRRAEENTSIAGQMGRELALLQMEMHRRNL
ncbi:proline dehydrogenase family protein [Pontibacter korlensis]|uniref:PutA protein n=1 Tax=Pontibacter korlensis TaxID=400092 RepID=A0A0E3ZDG3_9BACT|nr:proline dehydrogenase family protein [Pontibacter korlensis]AKD02258.1 PutA protein [Pontibacter korlensis]